MYANLKRCNFWLEQVGFSGHVISKDGLAVDPAMTEVVVNWKSSKNVFEIQSFLGLAGYYRRFVERFSTIAAPITKLTRKSTSFVWSQECENSFQQLKQKLTMTPILLLPAENE